MLVIYRFDPGTPGGALLNLYVKVCTLYFQGDIMAIQTTYTHACLKLASLLDEVTENREVVIIERRGSEDAPLIAVDELAGMLEIAHLPKR